MEPESIPSRAVRVELKGEPLVRLRSGRRVIRAEIMTGLAERDGGGPVEWGPQAAVPAQHCARPGHVGVRSSWGSGGCGGGRGGKGGRFNDSCRRSSQRVNYALSSSVMM